MSLLIVASVALVSCSREEPPPRTVKVIKPVAPPRPEKPANVATAEWIKETFGDTLVKKDASEIPSDMLAGKTIGIYYSAHWCPPCRGFTPLLVEVYDKIREKGNKFEVVLVSGDRSPSDMYEYMREAEMPWPAVPYEKSVREKLIEQYGVQAFPTLIIVNEDGYTVTKNGRNDVTEKRADAFKTW